MEKGAVRLDTWRYIITSVSLSAPANMNSMAAVGQSRLIVKRASERLACPVTQVDTLSLPY